MSFYRFLVAVAGCAPLCCGFVCVCIQELCRNNPVQLFYLLTCTMGSAPKWTCTASSLFWTRQLTDRAIRPIGRRRKKKDPRWSNQMRKRCLGKSSMERTNPTTICIFFPRSCLVVHATWSVIASEKDKTNHLHEFGRSPFCR